jgi:hypothetical protein
VPTGDPRKDQARSQESWDDELIGLDRDDPEVQAFAAHLERTRNAGRPGFTVEGYLAGMGDFADSANRAGGLRRLAAVTVTALLLLGALYAVWQVLVVVFSTFIG